MSGTNGVISLLLLTAVLCTSGFSQQNTSSEQRELLERRGPTGRGISVLLRMSDVRTELRLTPAQMLRVRQMLVEQSVRRRSLFQGLAAGSILNEPVDASELRSWIDLFNQQSEESLLSVLDQTQAQRVSQLQLQLHGDAVLSDPAVQRQLDLTLAQRRRLSLALSRPSHGLRRSPQMSEHVLGLLTANQRSKLERLRGQPFAFSPARDHESASRRTVDRMTPDVERLLVRVD